jgi:hypothetical protein
VELRNLGNDLFGQSGLGVTAASASRLPQFLFEATTSFDTYIPQQPRVETDLAAEYVEFEYTTVTHTRREKEHVGVGLGSWSGRDGLLRTSSQPQSDRKRHRDVKSVSESC